MRKGVLESEFTEEIVRISDDRSHSGRDVGEKVTILEDELMGFVKSVNVLRCRGSNSNWRINQDGLMLKSKSVYKSVTEEVSVWGWPLQTGELFGTGFSSSLFTVLSGRWSEGRFGYTSKLSDKTFEFVVTRNRCPSTHDVPSSKECKQKGFVDVFSLTNLYSGVVTEEGSTMTPT
ncbi:hypothetical protein HID58_006639 [Brassica napus]|uniref:Uncharacterized protein n=1 Tax=Brassica napus TaxID=3708 RepID=A0ABQ8EBY8_BRANA|nr:hypothetical protein HID58_006639 [Brassica napus]